MKTKSVSTFKYKCISCGQIYDEISYVGCPACKKNKRPASLDIVYETEAIYSDKQPFSRDTALGEGHTPIIALNNLAPLLGLKTLYMKNEFQNPTGSHKDRMSKNVVQFAKAMNAPGVTAASSGNAGVSLAIYAANAGVPCTIVSTDTIHPIYKEKIERTGAELILTDTVAKRWSVVEDIVKNKHYIPATNFTIPPVGSHPLGVQGYKGIAYEIYEHFKSELPEVIIVPVSRGDLLWGIFAGFKDLIDDGRISQCPRLVAVEPIPRLEKTLSGSSYTNIFNGDYSHAPSIGGETVTFQSLQAITESKGTAVTISASTLSETVKHIHSKGLFLESSSIAAFSAIAQLLDTHFISQDTVTLIIGTSDFFRMENK